VRRAEICVNGMVTPLSYPSREECQIKNVCYNFSVGEGHDQKPRHVERRGVQFVIEGIVMPKSMLVMGDGHFLPGRHHFVTR
jgi:hypothetical protein